MISWLARFVVHVSALIAPRADRARLKEEWLGELAAASVRGAGAVFRFALGAPAAAWSMRPPARLLSAISGDAKYAWRQLIRRPAHTLAVVACLVVGLVVSIGTFSVIQSLLYGDKPGVHNRRGMARLYLAYDNLERGEGAGDRDSNDELSLSEFALITSRDLPPSSVFTALGVAGQLPMMMTGNHGPAAMTGSLISGNYFKVLATERGAAGRLLDPSDDVPDGPPVAVVSDWYWRSHLDARPDAIGRTILVAGISVTVVGVAPPRFHGMEGVEPGQDESHGVQVWMPLSMVSRWPRKPEPDQPWLEAQGRLKPGRTEQDVNRELAVTSARIAAAFPKTRRNAALLVRPQAYPPGMSSLEVFGAFALVMLLPITVLAIGCANVANLQLARVAERSRELAVRLSLGASRGQLIRLLTLETLARAFAAVGISTGLLLGLMRYFQPFFSITLAIDWRVALFAAGLALFVALGTGLMPAWLVLRRTAAGQLKQSAQSGGLGHARMRASLVVAQVSLSLALLTATSLIVRSTSGMELSAPPVLREQIVATFKPGAAGMTPVEGRQFADTLTARAGADPRVRGASVSAVGHIAFGAPPAASSGPVSWRGGDWIGMTSSWLDVMDAKLLAGRRLSDADTQDVVMVSAHAAEIIAPAGSPIGAVVALRTGPSTSREARVVGVVEDIPVAPRMDRPDPAIYTLLPPAFPGDFTLRVRTTEVDAVSADLQTLITSVDSRMAWVNLRRGDLRFEDDAQGLALIALAVGASGAIALILSATGLFAVMSYIVMLRRREIGVRLAIGAAPGRIVALVMRQAFKLVSIGAAAGLALSVFVAFTMRANFVGQVIPTDPMVYGPSLGLMFFVGAIAAAVPALRAARVDPISTLRQD
jgi:macrolide transport system ATP-binding/permease protein